MNKKDYQKPEMQVVNINMSHHLLNNSPNSVSGNAGMGYGGKGQAGDVARGRSYDDDWDDE